jgi:chromosome segregation ATPase|tara:strand:- start:6692 stop:7126 length:435 start_codon:yes stop_codon:yes gene_type:complete
MKVEQVATWVGLVTAIAGAAANYGITENKVATLQQQMSELYNVEEIRTMEKRLTTLEVTQSNSDVGRLAATIATIEGEIKNAQQDLGRLESSVGKIQPVDTGEIDSRSSVNQSRIRALQNQIERVESKVERLAEKLDTVNDSPL